MAIKIRMTSLIMIPVFLFALVIVIILIFSSGKYINRDLPEIEQEGILRIVTDYNSIGYFVSGDTVSGFNNDLLIAISRYSNLKFEISVENDLAKSISDLKNGKYDLIARNIPVNANLKNSVAFTHPIVRNKLVLVQRKKQNEEDADPIRSHLDLASETICVPKYSPMILRLENLSDEIGDTIHIVQDSLYETPQLIMKVADGEINYTVSDVNTARFMAKALPEIDINTDIGFTHLEAWAVRKNSPILHDSINAWLSRVQDSKDFMMLYNKYYKQK